MYSIVNGQCYYVIIIVLNHNINQSQLYTINYMYSNINFVIVKVFIISFIF